MTQNTILHTDNLSIGYEKKTLLKELTLDIRKGEMICLLGPNGVGKSTLIKTLIGTLSAIEGDVFLEGQSLKQLTPRQLAKLISIVLTQKLSTANLTVRELVAMGRIPHTNWLGQLTKSDLQIVEESMKMVNITHFSERQIDSLSDGEKQRVMIAKALAQDTPFILLDEPTAHLDVTNRVALLSLLKKLAKETNKAILLSTHELEMAIQVADKIWLIDNHNQLIKGTPEDLALTGVFEKTFEGELVKFDNQTGTFRLQYTGNKNIALRGSGALAHWTKQALEKEGYNISNEANITVKAENDLGLWIIETNQGSVECTSIESLMAQLSEMNS